MMLNKDLDKDWSTIPDYITSGLLSGLVFIMGITMRGKRLCNQWTTEWPRFYHGHNYER